MFLNFICSLSGMWREWLRRPHLPTWTCHQY